MRKFIVAGVAALGFLAIGLTVAAPMAHADTTSSRAPTCIDVGTC